MKTRLILSSSLFLILTVLYSPQIEGQRPSTAENRISSPQKGETKSSPKPGTTPTEKPDPKTSSKAQEGKPEQSVTGLLKLGKADYRNARFKEALAKFEAALKQEPNHDEALGLAAVTAFRLDNQAQSREYFLRRAELHDQKDSVKAYCFYRVALTYWRVAHDLVAKYGVIEEGNLIFKLPEREAAEANDNIKNGLDFAGRAISIMKNFAEAYNIRNLLYSEAALSAREGDKIGKNRRLAIDALRRAIELTALRANGKREDAADFSKPTIRIAEFAWTKDEEEKLDDPMMKLIEGGRPIKRTQAIFPSVRGPKSPGDRNDPSAKGMTSEGGAYSIGSGRGALTAAYLQGGVKVEVLISTTGDVVFAHIVDGRSDLNAAAIIAARSWRFQPAKFEGRPVQVSGVISFEMKPGRGK